MNSPVAPLTFGLEFPQSMKKILIVAVAFLGMAMAPDKGEKLTLKERIDQSRLVKVYFNITDIKHNPNTVSNGLTKATGCPAFTESTPMPQEYVAAAEKLIDQLNEGFATTSFVEGDYASLPLLSSGMTKGSPDWVAVGEPLAVLVTTWGNYNVSTTGMIVTDPNQKKDLDNSLSMDAYIAFYSIADGKVKILDQKSLFSKATPAIETHECMDYAFFTDKFPANSLAEEFRLGITEKLSDLITKEMAAYDKAMKKKSSL